MHRDAIAVAVTVAVVLVPSAAGVSESGRKYFPLQPRNHWTFQDLRFAGTDTVTVARARAGTFRLNGFPGAPSMRVRWAGQTLQAWDGADRRWEAFLRLGAKAGTSYAVDLPHQLWSRARVTIASRRATVHNPVLGRTHRNTVRLAVKPNPELADAGVTDLWFAPRIGPVRWDGMSIAGPVTHVLSRARIGRRVLDGTLQRTVGG